MRGRERRERLHEPPVGLLHLHLAAARADHLAEAALHDLFLRDLGSTGGTFMEGHKVDRIRLQDGMEFLVGPAVLKFFDSGI